MGLCAKIPLLRGSVRALKMSWFEQIQKRERAMKKIICKVEYDTDTAELLQKKTSGCFGDPRGYEESLYRTPDGKLFLYAFGGSESPYAEETIKRMSAAKAEEWKNA